MKNTGADKKDLFFRYFNALKISGEDATFSLVRLQGKQIVEKIVFDHRKYDGVSAICEISKRAEIGKVIPPTLNLALPPSISKKLFYLLQWYLHIFPALGRGWKVRNADEKSVSSYESLDVESWKKIQTKKMGTAAVLESLDKTSLSYLKESQSSRIWMIPVGLYSSIDLNMSPRNQVSFIDIVLKGKQDQFPLIKNQLIRFLKGGQYWGNVLSLYPVKILGEIFFSKILKKIHHVFRKTGTLTNVGQWTIEGLDPVERWGIEATVAKVSPVGASMLEINGYLTLGVQFHPSLKFSQMDADEFIRMWKKNLELHIC
jgi:hypothetical protein